MGRKGMKGFIKSAARPSSKPAEEAAEAQLADFTAPTQQAAAAGSNASKQDAPLAINPDVTAEGAGSSDEGGQKERETRGQMLQRHKRELLAHKKAVQRMGKKSKDELAKLDAEIEARHANEIQQLEAAAAAAAAAPNSSNGSAPPAAAAAEAAAPVANAADGSAAVTAADKFSKYLVDLSVEDPEDIEQGSSKKQTKAQKRREKQAAKQAEREARIAAELQGAGPSEREEEEKALKALLAPLGLGIREIRADGHCLYRALEDQLEITAAAAASDDNDSSQLLNYQELRELAAEHIRQNKEQFAPFLLPEDESEDFDQYYEKYCFTLETTAAWGGHLELTALAAALQRQIKVHAVGMPTVTLGDEYAGEGQPPALELCYLRHAFGLGEHYNSTKKARFVRFSLGNEADEGEEIEGQQQQQQQEYGSEQEDKDSEPEQQ